MKNTVKIGLVITLILLIILSGCATQQPIEPNKPSEVDYSFAHVKPLTEKELKELGELAKEEGSAPSMLPKDMPGNKVCEKGYEVSGNVCVEVGKTCKSHSDCGPCDNCNYAGLCERRSTNECANDSGCSDGKVCLNCFCKERWEGFCRVDSDCAGKCEKCVENTCKVPIGACVSNDDCYSNRKCVNCKCVECEKDSECLECHKCINGSCEIPRGDCATDNDCKREYGGQAKCINCKCGIESVVTETKGCKTNADCPNCYECKFGLCSVPYEGCAYDGHCDLGYVCNTEKCKCEIETKTKTKSGEESCKSDRECPECYFCIGGVCQLRSPGGCAYDTQCAEGQFCNKNNDKCVCEGKPQVTQVHYGACKTDADCITNVHFGVCYKCMGGNCVFPAGACTDDSMCASGQRCDIAKCICVGVPQVTYPNTRVDQSEYIVYNTEDQPPQRPEEGDFFGIPLRVNLQWLWDYWNGITSGIGEALGGESEEPETSENVSVQIVDSMPFQPGKFVEVVLMVDGLEETESLTATATLDGQEFARETKNISNNIGFDLSGTCPNVGTGNKTLVVEILRGQDKLASATRTVTFSTSATGNLVLVK